MIRDAITGGKVDGVSMARTLVANNDLPHIFASGRDLPERPCTYCNKCLINDLKNPLGCYELSRFDDDYDRMIREAYSVYSPSPFNTDQPTASNA